MKNRFLPSPGILLDAAAGAASRFPAAVLSCIVGVAALWILVDLPYDSPAQPVLQKLWMLSHLGLPLFFAIRILAESQRWPAAAYWGATALGLAALVGYYFLLDPKADTRFENLQIPRFFGWLLCAHLFASVAAYLRRAEVRHFWEFNRQLFANFVAGALYGFVIFGGLAIALLAVDQLFDLNLDENIYARLYFVIFGFFLTFYFLWHTPREFDAEPEQGATGKVLLNLCKYILIPIIGLYFLILYAYSAKILLEWSLPKGWVSSLVLGFSIAGIFTWLLNYRLPESDSSRHIRFFHRWFWPIAAPMTALLFVAISRRIGDYGVTEPRYLVAHTGFWLALMCLFFLFSSKKDIRAIPLSLIVFALIFLFGPVNAFKMSQESQKQRLETLLIQNGLFADGKARPAEEQLRSDDAQSIESVFYFLNNRGALPILQDWFPFSMDSIPGPSDHYSQAGNLMEWLNIAPSLGAYEPGSPTVYIRSDYRSEWAPVGIEGYQYYFNRILYPKGNPPSEGRFLRITADSLRIEYLIVSPGAPEPFDSYELQPSLRDFWSRYDQNQDIELPAEARTLRLQGTRSELLLRIEDMTIQRDGDLFKVAHVNGVAFIKEKKE